jgi:hypothetical protein
LACESNNHNLNVVFINSLEPTVDAQQLLLSYVAMNCMLQMLETRAVFFAVMAKQLRCQLITNQKTSQKRIVLSVLVAGLHVMDELMGD